IFNFFGKHLLEVLMKVYTDIKKKDLTRIKKGIISIGFFDSMHLGHIKLLKTLVSIAHKKKMIPYVLTYDHLPVKKHKKFFNLTDKLKIFKSLGINHVIVTHFDDAFKQMPPQDFIAHMKKNFLISDYVVGHDFHFGSHQEGSIKTLMQGHCHIYPVDPVTKKGKIISTTYIKDLLLEGKIEQTRDLLGRPYSISGIVTKGKQLGRVLGFPTMNISNDNLIFPQDGVYITKTKVENKTYFSMTYVIEEIVESHLLGYNKFSYNFKIKVDFFKKIRDNQVFNNQDDLITQIKKDLTITETFFSIGSHQLDTN
ncbi:MAG: riboflavin biosynthesis protein RibF, partial [Spirochaetes bacterium]|nr:riboflavin biosynthesis protein RibF [Spirochaetota bacterium]